jgi:hypothetical protein
MIFHAKNCFAVARLVHLPLLGTLVLMAELPISQFGTEIDIDF